MREVPAQDAVADVPEQLDGRAAATDLSATADVSGEVVSEVPPWDAGEKPWGMRLSNRTGRSVYIKWDTPLTCYYRTTAGWLPCSFYRSGCVPGCQQIVAGDSCCAPCNAGPTGVVAIPPDGTLLIPMGGQSLYVKTTGPCSECECEDTMTMAGKMLAVSVQVYENYACTSEGCIFGSDGIIKNAVPQGASTSLMPVFTVTDPFVPVDREWDISGLVSLDARTAPQVDASADAVSSGPFPTPFAQLPGATYEIAANTTPPDASIPTRGACQPDDIYAHYRLVFSADGSRIEIARREPVPWMVLYGSLVERSESRLGYSVSAARIGGELAVWQENGILMARLWHQSLMGPFPPYCVQSPMTPVSTKAPGP